jgi:RNA polymerase sigma-70 factor (ECF subfamily)
VTSDDLALLKAWRAGDKVAGNGLLRRHHATIIRFFESRVDHALVEDLVQKTFLGALERRDHVPEGVRFKAYLLGIARNQFLMALRTKRRKAPPVPLDIEVRDGSTHGPVRVVARREEERLLREALTRLAEDLRAVLELFYWESLTTREVAVALDIPVGTVKTRLVRARRELREHVKALAPTPALAESTITNLESARRTDEG